MVYSVPAIFRAVVLSLVAAIFQSYEEEPGLGPQHWARRYSLLVDELSPIDNPGVVNIPKHPLPTGVYAHNKLLQGLTKLGDGQLLLPEEVLPDPTKTFLYVSTADGWVKKLFLASGQVQNWTFVGGRPLGLALDNAGDVLVCEPVQGLLLKVNKTTGLKQILATQAEVVKFGLVNSAIVASDGLIYFTDSSTKYNISAFALDFLEGRPYGRMMVYNPTTNTTKVLVRGLYFANGISLSKFEDFLIISEFAKFRILKYNLKGSKKGTTEIFIDNLPGSPDNIRYDKVRNRYFVALLGDWDALTDFVAKTPILRHLLAASSALYTLYDYNPFIGKVLEIDASGNPIRLYEDSDGMAIGFVTVGAPVGNDLYFSGLRDNYVGRIKLVQ